jgi:peptidoglycan/xylan/chitin deacetylase (PgdA/CDA1 family)
MGHAGEERVAARFSIERSVAAYERTYQDVLTDRYVLPDRSGPHEHSKVIDRKRFLRRRPEYIRQRWSAHKPATRGIIVMMHEVNNGPEDHARELATGLTAQSLDSIVARLRRDRWDIVTIEEALARLKHDDSGNRFVVLSFDDGYRDTLTRALPILERHDAPFTVYVPTGAPTRDLHSWWLGLRAVFQNNDHVDIACMGTRFECGNYEDKVEGFHRALAWVRADYRRSRLLDDTFRHCGISLTALNEAYFMNESELRILSQHRLAKIGAHTVSHNALSLLSPAIVREEFVSNRHYLEELLNCPIVDLAYPYGEPASCGAREFALATEVGFRSAVTSCYGALLEHHWRSRCELPRVAAGGKVDLDKFATAVMTL